MSLPSGRSLAAAFAGEMIHPYAIHSGDAARDDFEEFKLSHLLASVRTLEIVPWRSSYAPAVLPVYDSLRRSLARPEEFHGAAPFVTDSLYVCCWSKRPDRPRSHCRAWILTICASAAVMETPSAV